MKNRKPAPRCLANTPATRSTEKKGLHPRNRFGTRYDFPQLIACLPELSAFVAPNAYGDDSIDFSNPGAVRALNKALLKQAYGIGSWEIPDCYLCPPIPGRADYLHALADLLSLSNGGEIPYGENLRMLDIGVGANCIYPLVGHGEYGWRFVGTDIDRQALDCAQAIVDANSGYRDAIELRWQPARSAIFKDVMQPDELFDLTLCNPPFHASQAEATAGTERKWKNLGKAVSMEQAPVLNLGGQNAELCCPGGEAGFITRMIAESMQFKNQCLWFTTLVSKATSLPAIYRALKTANVEQSKTIDMTQGQKKSRFVAWTFLTPRQQQAWRNRRRGESGGN